MTGTKVTYLGSVKQLPPRDDRDWVISQELIDHAGITYRQLDYWCRTGLLTPLEAANPGSGLLRRFHESQAERARLIRLLLEGGMTLPVVRTVIDDLTEHGTVQIGALTITVHNPGDAA